MRSCCAWWKVRPAASEIASTSWWIDRQLIVAKIVDPGAILDDQPSHPGMNQATSAHLSFCKTVVAAALTTTTCECDAARPVEYVRQDKVEAARTATISVFAKAQVRKRA